MGIEATTERLIGLIPPVIVATVLVSLTKSTLTQKDENGKRIREGKYIVKVVKGSDTKYIGPFKTKSKADEYAKKVKTEYPAYKVSIVQ